MSLTPDLALEDGRTQAMATTICEQVVLRAALQALTVEQQQVITLKFWGGLSNLEIAECMGRTEGAIKALQHRAVQRLQHLLVHGQRAQRATAEDPERGTSERACRSLKVATRTTFNDLGRIC